LLVFIKNKLGQKKEMKKYCKFFSMFSAEEVQTKSGIVESVKKLP